MLINTGKTKFNVGGIEICMYLNFSASSRKGAMESVI